MSWSIRYAAHARQDLRNIYEYIAYSLHEPGTAARMSNAIMDAVDSLQEFPARHKIYEYEPWKSVGLRTFPVKNYMILYAIHEDEKAVTVIRIMYGGRDIRRQLEEMDAESI